VALALTASARGGLILGTDDIEINGGFNTVFDTVPVKLMMTRDFTPGVGSPFPISGTSIIGASDVGKTWRIDQPSTDVVLAELRDADLLGAFGVQVSLFNPDGDSFGRWFTSELTLVSQGQDLDLIGARTDEIIVTLLAFSTTSPGSDINGDGVWTNYSMTFRYDFVSIPAPGATSLLAVAGVFARRRRHRV